MAGLVPFNRKRNELGYSNAGSFYNMLDDFFSDSWAPSRNLGWDTFKLDVKETEKAYIIEAELPGVDKEDIDLDLSNECLTISVKKEESTNEEKENYVHRERRTSSMSRSIRLGDAVFEDIRAKLENGILTISVARKDAARTSAKINIE